MSAPQIENLVSHVASGQAVDSLLSSDGLRREGGAQNVHQLIRSLTQLMRDVSFFAASEQQVAEILVRDVQHLPHEKAELIAKLIHSHLPDWKRLEDETNCDAQMLLDSDWNLKLIDCMGDVHLNEPRVQFHWQTGEKVIALDADENGVRHLYNKLEEVQCKLDQLAKSSLQRK